MPGPVQTACALVVVLSTAAATPTASTAPQPATTKLVRVGFLSPSTAQTGGAGVGGVSGRGLSAWRQGLREHGWVEGRNLIIEYRGAEGRYERLPELAAELVQLNVDVIFANAAPAALAAKRATSTIPIVYETFGDPVSAGLVQSLARPGGNLTGLSGLALELSGKRLELLRELMPGLTHVAVIVNPSSVMARPTLQETEHAAQALGIRLRVVELREPADLERGLATIGRERSQALLLLQDPMFAANAKRILSALHNNRLPAVFFETGWVQAGGLMSYSPNLVDIFRRAAAYVDRILKGARPADLPVEQPTKFELAINLKTAKALGVTIPPSLLLRADQVVE